MPLVGPYGSQAPVPSAGRALNPFQPWTAALNALSDGVAFS